MEINKSNMTAYAFTVKDNRSEQTDYNFFFNHLWKKYIDKGDIILDCKYYEKDSKGKGHYHGIVYITKGFYRKKLCPKNYHLKLDELYNREQWMNYITKDQDIKLPNLFTEEQKHEDLSSHYMSPPDSPIADQIAECCLKLTKRIV